MTARPNDADVGTDEGWHEVVPRAPAPGIDAVRDAADEAAPDPMDELRALLVGPEQARLHQLETRPVKPAVEDVAALLPEAVRRRVVRDGELARALETTIEGGLERSARRNPKALADAIHPALGPAIRKAIQAALAQALEGFNAALENSLSPRGLSWRFEALRTGKPFAEVALLKTLIYRVEQVFLIHRETGVLLASVANPSAIQRDPELVSSMLSAIRDFAVDSFGANPDDELDRIDLAGLRIHMVGSPDAVLAAVVRGAPPESLRAKLEVALEELGAECADAFAGFQGDSAPFEAHRYLLEDCLGGEERARRRSPIVALVAPALAVTALVAIGWLFWRARAVEAHQAAVVRALEASPGTVVVAAHERDGVLVVKGFVDPAAPAPEAVAAAVDPVRGLDRLALEFTPFEAPGAAFIEPRVRQRLAPPVEVDLRVDDAGVVHLAGPASGAWIVRARAIAPTVTGVTALDDAGLVDYDRAQLDALTAALDRVSLRFPLGRADLPAGDALSTATVQSVADLARAAGRAGAFVRVTLAPVHGALEGAAADLAVRRMAAVRALLAPVAGAALLFEPRLVVDGEVPLGESGAVILQLEVLAAGPARAAGR